MGTFDANTKTVIEQSTRFRQKFLVWTVAIASSLSTTGVVSLPPAAAWAQEEPAAADESKQADTKEGFDDKEFGKLLNAKEFEKAGEMLDAAIAADPDNAKYVGMNMSLAMNQLRADAPAALTRLKNIYENLLERDSLDAQSTMALSTSAMYLTNMDKEASVDAKLAILDQAHAKLAEMDSPAATSAVRNVIVTKTRLLTAEDRDDDAKALMDGLVDQAREDLDPESTASVNRFLSIASIYSSSLGGAFPEAVEKVQEEANRLALDMLKRDDAGASEFAAYYSLKSALASRLSYTDPKQASAILDELSEQLEAFQERASESDAKGLARYESMIKSSRSRIESALAREELIGTVAPALDAEYFVGMEEVSMDDLKGKVVLLDFWAVWCGPCIATFPHLQEWHEKYSEKGLTIIGVTKFYGYAWDEEAGRATRGDEPSAKEELAMLAKFRESYDLHHGFAVTPSGSEYSKAFHVTGIPQAVLLDKEGKIRMIRVGSGEANAKALEAEIEALIGH